MISALHWFLALISVAVMILVGLEAGRRALLQSQPGRLSARFTSVVLLLLGVTAASGLGMFLGGAHPHEELHFLYAVLAFAAVPVASLLASRLTPRGRALASVAGALIGLVLIVRLFMTG